MTSFLTPFRRPLRALVAATLLAGVLAVPVFADTSVATAGVTGGTLSEVASGVISMPIVLNGTNQTGTSTALSLDTNDPTGTGNGWNLTISATQFSTTTPIKTLSATALTVTGVTAVCKQGTCTNPTAGVAIIYPLTVGTTAARMLSAAAATGMGEFTISPALAVAVPANTLAGSYTSTVTLAIVSAP